MLALIAGVRLVVFKQAIDWLTVGLVIVAAVAAIAHRNAAASLEVRGRAEAESFARILRGLSRSVSAEAIVDATQRWLDRWRRAPRRPMLTRQP